MGGIHKRKGEAPGERSGEGRCKGNKTGWVHEAKITKEKQTVCLEIGLLSCKTAKR
jgi:hypothetical protein